MADNQYFQAEPLVQDVAKALAVGHTPYTLTFFEQINSPQGPWLQMLQKAYYTDDRSGPGHRGCQAADEGHRLRGVTHVHLGRSVGALAALTVPGSDGAGTPAPSASQESAAMYAGRNRRLGFIYVLPALLFVLVFTAYPLHPDGLDVVPQLVAHQAAQVHRSQQLLTAGSGRAVLDVARASPSSTP